MSIGSTGPLSAGVITRKTAAVNTPMSEQKQRADSADNLSVVSLSDEAMARYQQAINDPAASQGRKIDTLIASWFKHASPANSEADKRATAEEDHQKQVARAAGRVWSDPGHLADPVKEPSRATVEMAVGVIETDQILKALQTHRDHPKSD